MHIYVVKQDKSLTEEFLSSLPHVHILCNENNADVLDRNVVRIIICAGLGQL